MEEHFKNKLKNHKVDWDKEALLGNLKQELSPSKKRFDWKWFLLLPLLLFITCWGWNNLQMPVKNATSMSIENNSQLNKKESNLIKETPIKPNEINIENNKLNSNKNQQASNKEAELKQTASNIKQVIITDDLKDNSESKLKLGEFSSADLPKTNSPMSKEQALKDSNLANEKTIELPKQIIEIPIANTNESEKMVTINIDEVRNNLLALNPIPFSGWKANGWIDDEDNLPMLDTTAVDFQKEETKERFKNPFYISAIGELGLVYRSRTFNSNNSEFVNRLEDNEETETSLFAITTSICLGYQHPSGWSLQSGLEYNEINEVFNYNESRTDTLRMPSEKNGYYIIDDMDSLFIPDSLTLYKTEERIVKHFNEHRFSSIPLQVGYQFNLKKARLVTRLGLSYTFAHNFKGRTNLIFESGGNEIIEPNPEIQFKLKNRVGLQVGLALEYPFGKQSQIFATVSYRRSPKLTRGILIEQSYHSLSVGVGIRYSFGRD